MADDEDVIFVDVVARLDEGAAEEAAESLKDKFKDATEGVTDGLKGAADKIKDEFGSIGDKFKDAFSRSLPKELDTAAEKVGDNVGDKISTSIGEKLKEKLGGAGGKLKDVFDDDLAKDLGKEFGGQLGEVVTAALGDTLPKGISESLGKAVGEAVSGKGWKKSFGDAAGDILNQTLGFNATDSFSGIHDQIHATVGNVKDTIEELGLTGVAGGKFAPAFTSALGPVAASLATLGPAESLVEKLPFGIGDFAQQTLPGADASLGDRIKEPFRILGGDILHPSRIAKDHQYDNLGNFVGDGPPQEDGTDKLYNSIFGGGSGGGGGGSSSTSANEVDVQSSVATVSAGSVTLGGNISLPGASGAGSGGGGGSSSIPASIGKSGELTGGSSGDGYSALGSYSSGGDITGPGPTGVDSVLAMLAPGERVLTPEQNDAWKSMLHFAGGGETPASPAAPSGDSDASASGEGESVDSGGGSDQGGDGGAPGTVSGTQSPGSVQDAADQAQNPPDNSDTSVVDPTQEGIAGGTKTSKGIQDQSFGYGKGFQVTGQGLIGFAESAPGAIASAAASGASGGPAPAGIAAGAGAAALTSLWNTIGEPELNEAITQGVKIGADIASAPEQEFAVGGENFQNWSQKLIGGEIGNVTNLINTAANTQAPLTPQQGSGQAGQVGQAAQPNGNLGGQPSPQGTPNDPMHVSVVNGGPSGGDQSSYMSSVGMNSSGTA
jgi:hypothetical protein